MADVIGLQVIFVIFVAGSIDILKHDAVTSAAANTHPLLDAGLNAFVLVTGGAAFVLLVGVS